MPPLDLEQLVSDLRSRERVVGLLLAGSRSKGLQGSESDTDVYIIVDDRTDHDTIEVMRGELTEAYADIDLDLANQAIQTVGHFAAYAQIGTEYDWDRYNLVHAQLLYDGIDGRLAGLLAAKASLSPDESQKLIGDNLGAYVNLTYRSVTSEQRAQPQSAMLDRAETLGPLLTLLFALEGRVRPYNKYLQWELEEHPLQTWSQTADIGETILQFASGNTAAQLRLFQAIRRVVMKTGHASEIRAWGDKLDILNSAP